jgi:hypothetical protein|tara:strand:+ start:15805 stop:15978 length:174 start_codon:yes stop_codon:yes gene_type:complete
MSERGCFLRSGAEERAPKKGEVEAESRARGDMPDAFHAKEHKLLPLKRQDTDKEAAR